MAHTAPHTRYARGVGLTSVCALHQAAFCVIVLIVQASLRVGACSMSLARSSVRIRSFDTGRVAVAYYARARGRAPY